MSVPIEIDMRKKKDVILENIKLFAAGAKGVAIGKTEEGKTVLVSGAIPGDVVNARVKKSKSKYFEGKWYTINDIFPCSLKKVALFTHSGLNCVNLILLFVSIAFKFFKSFIKLFNPVFSISLQYLL